MNVETVPNAEVRLRPLSIGEIFDRAVTLYVRNLAPFLIVAAFVAVPMAIAQYFLTAANANSWQQIVSAAQHGGSARAPEVNPWIVPPFMLGLIVQPFMYVAMASLVGRLYRSEPRDWRASYGVALRHTGGIVLTVLCALAILCAGAFALVIAASIATVVAALLFTSFMPLGIVAMVLTAVILFAGIVFLMLLYLALALAFNAIGIEEAPFGRAIGEGFSRVFNRGEIKKAALLSLAVFAVQIGMSALTLASQALFGMVLHVPFLDAVLSGVLLLLSTGFFGVLIAVYYFDLRVRREGLDIFAALETLQTTTPG